MVLRLVKSLDLGFILNSVAHSDGAYGFIPRNNATATGL